MDLNKLAKLHEIEYKINCVCGLCEWSIFPYNEWGTCELYTYDHLKHSAETNQLSIHKFGSCGKFKMDELKKAARLVDYINFIEEKK